MSVGSGTIYLASDLHLGSPTFAASRARERLFVQWLEDAAAGTGHAAGFPATEIHLVGDLFDFWYEYRHVVPRGGSRLMGAIARLTDQGLPVHFYPGNHDLWTFGYLEEELGLRVHPTPVVREWDGLRCYIGHGDGLGPGDWGYKRLKRLFHNRFLQVLFQQIHPDWTHGFARRWSAHSRQAGAHVAADHAPESEWLWQYAAEYLRESDAEIDCFLFGHRHAPMHHVLPVPAQRVRTRPPAYINLGDWIAHFTYVRIAEGEAHLLRYNPA